MAGVYRAAVGGTPRSVRRIGGADVAHAMPAMIDGPSAVKQGVA
ncbi:hypothetical protein [Streptomyces huasconensis]